MAVKSHQGACIIITSFSNLPEAPHSLKTHQPNIRLTLIALAIVTTLDASTCTSASVTISGSQTKTVSSHLAQPVENDDMKTRFLRTIDAPPATVHAEYDLDRTDNEERMSSNGNNMQVIKSGTKNVFGPVVAVAKAAGKAVARLSPTKKWYQAWLVRCISIVVNLVSLVDVVHANKSTPRGVFTLVCASRVFLALSPRNTGPLAFWHSFPRTQSVSLAIRTDRVPPIAEGIFILAATIAMFVTNVVFSTAGHRR